MQHQAHGLLSLLPNLSKNIVENYDHHLFPKYLPLNQNHGQEQNQNQEQKQEHGQGQEQDQGYYTYESSNVKGIMG